MVILIATIIGVLAGGLGLVSLLDTLTGLELTTWFLEKIWSVLQFLLTPIVDLFQLIFNSLSDLVRGFF